MPRVVSLRWSDARLRHRVRLAVHQRDQLLHPPPERGARAALRRVGGADAPARATPGLPGPRPRRCAVERAVLSRARERLRRSGLVRGAVTPTLSGVPGATAPGCRGAAVVV